LSLKSFWISHKTQNDIKMIGYFAWGLAITFLFDVILSKTENALNNKERIGFVLLWPFFLVWFIYYVIKDFRNR